MIFSHHTVHLISKTNHDISQHPVVHIQTAFPYNLSGIDSEGISLLDMIVQHRCQQVIGGSDRMEVSGKVEIQILHGNNLGVSASGCPSFDPKAGAERRLAQRDQGLLPHLCHRFSKSDCRSRLSLSCGGRVDRCHKDELSVFVVFDLIPQFI